MRRPKSPHCFGCTQGKPKCKKLESQSLQRSPIFPPWDNPVHPGYYVSYPLLEDVQKIHAAHYIPMHDIRYWDGKRWSYKGETSEHLAQGRYWFGITK